MNAGSVIARFGADIANFMSGIQQMVGAASGFASHMGSVAATASSTFASMGSTVASHVSSMAANIGRGFLSIGPAILGAVESAGRWIFFGKQVADTAVGIVSGFFAQNAAMEQSRVAFAGLLGSGQAADAMLRRLQALAAATPFEFPELVQSTQELLGMGFAARDIIPVMTAVGDAAAGVGRGREGVQAITLALGQMQARGKVTGQDMMQLTEAGIPAWKILAQAMGLTVAQVQDLSQQGKLGADSVTALWHGMERMYGGQMAGQAQTFNGLLSTLHDNAMMALQAFAGPTFAMARNSLSQLTALAGSPAFSALAKSLGTELAQGIANVVRGVQQAVAWFGQFTPQANQLRTAFANLGAALSPLIQHFQQAGTAGAMMNAALVGLRAVIIFVASVIATLANGLATVIRWFQSGNPQVQALATMFQRLGTVISSALLPVWSAMVDSWHNLVTAITPIMPQVQMVATALGVTLVVVIGLVIGVIGGLITAFAGVLAGVIRFVTGIVVIISGMVATVSAIIQFFVDLFTGHFDRLGADLSNIMLGIATMFSGALIAIGGIFEAGWALVMGFTEGFVNTIVAFFTGLWQTLVGGSIIPDMVNGIINWFTTLGSQALSLVSAMVAAVVGFFSDLASQAADFIAGAVTTILGKFDDMKSGAISAAQGLLSGVSGALAGLGAIAASAGQAVIDGIVGAINAGIGWVSDAASHIASTIANFLPHSPAKEGPLSHLDEFGPAVPGMFAAGIMAGIPAVEAAVRMMVEPVQGQVGGSVSATPLAGEGGIARPSRGGDTQEMIALLRRIERHLSSGNRVRTNEIIDALGGALGETVHLHTGGR